MNICIYIFALSKMLRVIAITEIVTLFKWYVLPCFVFSVCVCVCVCERPRVYFFLLQCLLPSRHLDRWVGMKIITIIIIIIIIIKRIELLFNYTKRYVVWLALLIHILGNLGSDVGPETGYPNRGFSYFYLIFRHKCRGNTWNWATIASFYILSNPLLFNQPSCFGNSFSFSQHACRQKFGTVQHAMRLRLLLDAELQSSLPSVLDILYMYCSQFFCKSSA
jgi:hypothetical protein